MAMRSKSLVKDQDSLLISGINTSKLHKRLENYGKSNISNLLSSRLELSSSRISDDLIKVQESFSISEIYKEVESNKENLLAELYEQSIEKHENSDFLKFLEENTAVSNRHKTYSKLDESSVVGENCQVIVNTPEIDSMPLYKRQQKKYYKAFMVMQALFVSTKEATERKIKSLYGQIDEVNQLIKENREFGNKLEEAVILKLDVIKEEMMQKFVMDAEKLIDKYQTREDAQKTQTKNKIIMLRKDLDVTHDKVFKSFDESKAKNSEELLRKNCEMRLKIARIQSEQQKYEEDSFN